MTNISITEWLAAFGIINIIYWIAKIIKFCVDNI